MNENELFQAALGLLPPWLVSHCTFDESAGRLDIHRVLPATLRSSPAAPDFPLAPPSQAARARAVPPGSSLCR